MQNVYIILGIYAVAILLVSVVLLFIPLHAMGSMTKIFSFKTFGIRKVRRWNSRTDTLGNLFLWISFFLCVLYPVIPFSIWLYGIFLVFSWLACVSRAIRLTQVHSTDRKLLVIFLINITCGFGLMAGMGFFNNFTLWNAGIGWAVALSDGSARDILWYLREPNLFAYLLQVTIMFLPLMVFWGQFKYMRLENTFKASNIGFYALKMVVWNLVFVGLSFYGCPLLYHAYNAEADTKIVTNMDNFPSFYVKASDVIENVSEYASGKQEENQDDKSKEDVQQEQPEEESGE